MEAVRAQAERVNSDEAERAAPEHSKSRREIRVMKTPFNALANASLRRGNAQLMAANNPEL
jgi:glutamyl-tRNA reductase